MANAFLSKLQENRTSKTDLIDATLTRAVTEDRDISEIELANIQALKLEVEKLDERINQIAEIELRNSANAEIAAKVDSQVESRNVGGARVTSEEATYHNRSKNDFLADAIAAEFGGSYDARERIARYQREVLDTRDSGTSNFAGLVVPQYLVDSFAQVDSEGDFRFGLGKSLRLTDRLSVFGEIEYDTSSEWEWSAGAEYLLTKQLSLISEYHSEHGIGRGVSFRF
jgi:hypothetical protein